MSIRFIEKYLWNLGYVMGLRNGFRIYKEKSKYMERNVEPWRQNLDNSLWEGEERGTEGECNKKAGRSQTAQKQECEINEGREFLQWHHRNVQSNIFNPNLYKQARTRIEDKWLNLEVGK